jgi:UDP-2-acetamido-2,6-beta-L-arabino-hexul-4-ose reductase
VSIVITGSSGFVGRHLQWRLRELAQHGVTCLTRDSSDADVVNALSQARFVFHLAGANRPEDPAEFDRTNAGFTSRLCDVLAAAGHRAVVVFASSTQAALENPYGRSKLAAEERLRAHGEATGSPVALLRLTNVFGKWARPFYNSAVATFCHQVANGLPLTIHDPAAPLRLVYVDDVIDAFVALLRSPPLGVVRVQVGPEYASSVGEVAATLQGFAQSRTSLISPPVGTGLTRALYATYLSHLRADQFAYSLPRHGDARGEFVEMLKTPDCGQFSYFTAHPGVTRGGHYHHTKSEKFLVLQGTARFGFRQLDTGATAEIVTRGGEARVVETIPGWTHDITNIGDDDLIVMLWANEIFDRARPDTVAMRVVP